MQTIKQFLDTNPGTTISLEIMTTDSKIWLENSGNGLGYAVEMRGFYSLEELQWLIYDLKALNATIPQPIEA